MTKTKILVTGASGFIGSNLVRRLIQDKNNDVHILIKKDPNLWRIEDIKDKLSIHFCDLTDFDSARGCLNDVKPEYIFHLATYGAYPRIQKEIKKIVDVSYGGTVNLVLASMDIHYKLFVNTGTTSEYGTKKEPMKETDVLEPNMEYGAAKAASSIFCQAIARKYDKPICTLRLFSVYGYYEEPFRLVPDVFTKLLKQEEVEVSGGSASRDFIFIEDIIDAYLQCMKLPEKIKGEIINIGSGAQIRVRDMINNIADMTGNPEKILWGKKKLENFESDIWVADISKAKILLGWQPKHNLKASLKKLKKWYEDNLELYKG